MRLRAPRAGSADLATGAGATSGVGAWEELASLPRVPARHPWRWVLAALLVLAAILLIRSLAFNHNLRWPVVGRYLFSPAILSGVGETIELTLICQAIGIALGTLLALARLARNPVANTFAVTYGWIFRGIPVLVQMIFWYNLALLFPRLGIGLPFSPWGIGIATNSVISGFSAAILGLGLNEGAYMAEIIRAGIIGVDSGQAEAARALGMRQSQVLRHVVLPQALRVIVPPTANQLILMLKATSLTAFIAGGDLLTQAEAIYSNNFQVIPLLIVASLWYIALTAVATVGQQMLERRVGRGALGGRAAP